MNTGGCHFCSVLYFSKTNSKKSSVTVEAVSAVKKIFLGNNKQKTHNRLFFTAME